MQTSDSVIRQLQPTPLVECLDEGLRERVQRTACDCVLSFLKERGGCDGQVLAELTGPVIQNVTENCTRDRVQKVEETFPQTLLDYDSLVIDF